LSLLLDLLALCGCLAACGALLAGACYVGNVAFPRLEQYLAGRNAFGPQAEARARELFLSKLTPRQRRSWRLRRLFRIEAASGTRYTVVPYDSYNIRTSDALFCLQVAGATPFYDKLLAQKLLIECDEPLFLATANIRTYSEDWQPRREAARRSCRERGLSLEGTAHSAGVRAASESTP